MVLAAIYPRKRGLIGLVVDGRDLHDEILLPEHQIVIVVEAFKPFGERFLVGKRPAVVLASEIREPHGLVFLRFVLLFCVAGRVRRLGAVLGVLPPGRVRRRRGRFRCRR